jgi:hypothetical protein
VAWSESANGISRSKFANLLFDNCSPSPRPVEGLKVLSREVICFFHVVVVVVTTKVNSPALNFRFSLPKKYQKKFARISKKNRNNEKQNEVVVNLGSIDNCNDKDRSDMRQLQALSIHQRGLLASSAKSNALSAAR